MDDQTLPISDTNDAPFGSPDPDEDAAFMQHPSTDSDIDSQELYDQGLAAAAGEDEHVHSDVEDSLPPDRQ